MEPCENISNQIALQIQERQQLLSQINEAESPSERNYLRQMLRLVNREISRLRNAYNRCVLSNTPRPDLYCEIQTTELTLNELGSKLIEIRYNSPGNNSFQWAVKIKNRGNAVAKGPFSVDVAMDQIGPNVTTSFMNTIEVPATDEIQPGETYITEYISGADLINCAYSFYIRLDMNMVIREKDETNNYYEYHAEYVSLTEKWIHNKRIQGQLSRATPAIYEFNERLHMVHVGDTNNDLWHSEFDGNNWTNNTKIPYQQSKAGPSIATYDQKLHMVHLGNSDNAIWHSWYDGTSWTPNVQLKGKSSKATPVLAMRGNYLHMVHLGNSGNELWHSYYNGQEWSVDVKIPDQKSKSTPALVNIRGMLHMVHLGNSDNQIWHSWYDGLGWSYDRVIPDQFSKASPSLANFDNKIYMVHVGNTSNQIYQSSFDGTIWTDNELIPDQLSKRAPALATFNNRLYMVHLGNTSNDIWYSWRGYDSIIGQ